MPNLDEPHPSIALLEHELLVRVGLGVVLLDIKLKGFFLVFQCWVFHRSGTND
jgi:hypothetical protein